MITSYNTSKISSSLESIQVIILVYLLQFQITFDDTKLKDSNIQFFILL